MAFNDRLKDARLGKGLTQEKLAELIGVAKTTLTGYEKGNREPNMLTIQKIMHALQIDANFLWQDEMKENKTIINSVDWHEIQHIKKYRTLDEHGKTIVNFVLNEEYTRVETKQINTENAEEGDNSISISFFDLPASAGTGLYLTNTDYENIKVPKTPTTIRADFALKVSGNSMEPYYNDMDILLVQKQPSIEQGDLGIFVLNNEGYFKKLGNNQLISYNSKYPPINIKDDDNIICCGKVIGKL